MFNWRRLVIIVMTSIMSIDAFAQDTATNEANTELMRSNGKIYVVMAIVITILAGLVFFVIRLDRKISKLEQQG